MVAREIFEPYEKRFAELEESIRNRRDPVSVTAAAINHKGELMLTLSDGTILTPGRIAARAMRLNQSMCRPCCGGCDDAGAQEIVICRAGGRNQAAGPGSRNADGLRT